MGGRRLWVEAWDCYAKRECPRPSSLSHNTTTTNSTNSIPRLVLCSVIVPCHLLHVLARKKKPLRYVYPIVPLVVFAHPSPKEALNPLHENPGRSGIQALLRVYHSIAQSLVQPAQRSVHHCICRFSIQSSEQILIRSCDRIRHRCPITARRLARTISVCCHATKRLRT
jgi:hypothetical protein